MAARLPLEAQALELLLRDAARGKPAPGSGLARAGSMAALLAERSAEFVRRAQGSAVAVGSGDWVFLVENGRVGRYPRRRFLLRPRRFTPEPGAAGLALPSETGRGPRWLGERIVECRIELCEAERASLLFVGDPGFRFAIRVGLEEIEDALTEAQALLRSDARSRLLSVRSDSEILRRSRGRAPSRPAVEVRVYGHAPWGVRLAVDGVELGDAPDAWRAAAEVALSKWPVGSEGWIRVMDVALEHRGMAVEGLTKLYVASVVRRRIGLRLAQLRRAYR